MKLAKLATIGLVVLTLGAGAAAAAPGDAPTDGTDEPGPPDDLPGPVPDFVGEIHDLIRQFLSGDLTGSLGEAIADVTPGGGENASEGATGG